MTVAHRTPTPRLSWVGTAVVACLLAGAARADEPLWEVGAGVGGLRLAHYRGSDQARAWLLPVPYVVYRGDILRADRNGARALLFEHPQAELDISVSATAPVKSSTNRARQGMADLPATVELGPKLEMHLLRHRSWQLDLRLPVRAVFAVQSGVHHAGWSVAPVLNLDRRVDGFKVGLQAGPLWGDARLHRRFYDVSTADATTDRPTYASRGGFAGWQATAAVSQRMDHAWWGAFLRLDDVSGAVFEDSPLIRRRQTWSAGLAVSWVFAESSRRVSVDR